MRKSRRTAQRLGRRCAVTRLLTAFAAFLLLGTTVAASAPAASTAALPVVLTAAIGSNSAPTEAGLVFADAVRRLSKGSLVIAFQSPPGGLTAESESLAIKDVRQGATQMGWIPTRGWDTQSVNAFTALQAPFLITDYVLLEKVLTGAVGRGMLSGTRGMGVRTLGLAAADLRRPLGARKSFVAPADFRGAKLRTAGGSRVSSAMLEALGATASPVASGAALLAELRDGTVDGAETAVGYILLNGYYQVAKYVTANLVFFPRVDAISINERAFQALTPQQRAILEKAATETARGSFKGLVERDQEQLRLLCLGGLRVATSTKAELAALLRAEQPVYTMLKRHRPTANRIAQIQKLKKATKPAAPLRIPAGCAA